ncbi:MAG: glycoside hydrolase family 2 TIM barrel-domain containing protein [Suipraeoptans sp.]
MVKQVLNQQWSVGEKASVTDLVGVKGEVKNVILPHDAAMDQMRDPQMEDGYQKGYFPDKAYQYERKLDVPNEWKEKSVYLEFEGVFRDAEVLLNKNAVARKHHGYTGFTVCLDPFLNYGSMNDLVVTAKSGKEQHWYSGTGIYRPVNLLVGELIHIAPNGVKVTPVEIEDDSAVITVETKICNKSRRTVTVSLQSVIKDMDGNIIGEELLPVTILGNAQIVCRQRIGVTNITRWGVDTPVLYDCVSMIKEEGRDCDQCNVRFGIRTLSVDAGRGFRLNGKEIKLRGACIHHDAGIIGAAAYKSAEKRRIRKLKEAGFNAVRMAHNPSSRAVLEACDEEGMLVMEETFNVWNVMRFIDDYAAFFQDNWETDLASVVDNAYNHPSVIMYCIGNEIQEIITASGTTLCREIANKMHELDPQRYSTLAINGMVCVFSEMGKYAEQMAEGADINQAMVDVGEIMSKIMLSDTVGDGISECADCVDIAGYNYMQARYEIDSEAHPNRVIVGSETHPREIDKLWSMVKKYPNIIGDFTWVGWNYLGEAGIGRNNYGEAVDLTTSYLGEYPWVGSACGDFDIIGNRTPISYYREIVYGLRKDPYISILEPAHYGEFCQESPWGWADSYSGWTWDGYEGKKVQIAVYADADEVILFKNDIEIGRAACDEEQRFKALFESIYEPGTLRAVSIRGGEITGEYVLESAKSEPRLIVKVEEKEVTFSSETLIFADISVEDEQGRICHCCNPQITAELEGSGSLLGMGNGSTITDERYDDNVHTMHNGKLLAIIRPTAPGEIIVNVSADGFKQAQAVVLVKASGAE